MAELIKKIIPLFAEFGPYMVFLRLMAAALMGGLIGSERGRHGRPAGLRTHMLICIGAAMTSLTSVYLSELGVTSDIARISAQVISEPVNRVITIGTAVVKVSSSEKANVSSSGFICPLERGKFVVSAYYGDGRNHKAIDLAANRGVAIFAAAGGTVTYAGYDGDYGYNVVIDHGNGIKTRYAHASYLTVSKGQVVSQGDMIAAVGSTGYSTGNHLHFEVIVNGTRVNPAPYIGL